VQQGNIRDRAGAVRRNELLNGRVPGGGILNRHRPLMCGERPALALQFRHGFTWSFRAWQRDPSG